ncbi:MAG: UDP-N-acetylmuramoyl-tripeptide--D-alanyl-D-alanine ligase [Clostridiales bacterium]|jgi:UDP-N-acetylmuramoyl-tripeptide--D-alanyl-D-alanine ligase|nr:UDP-N-acetylmuramoyl-tripeptide--D-alanyl-D-alanine ligase [Clostridiales bacterium]
MLKFTCKEVLEAVNGVLLSGDKETLFDSVSTDSRKISGTELFIPIIGENFDGHNFLEASLITGAIGVLTQKNISFSTDKVVIKVDDTLKALRDLAAWYRLKFKIPFVGITGSVGKTSTKDMVASVIGQKLNVLKTEGNFNNEIGLPLTIFNLDSMHQAGVIEMGMSGFGEISRLTSIVKPDIAIITNIGLSHIEKLGSRENILKAKLEILEGIASGGLVILNGDDNLLYGTKGLLKFRTVFYGMGEEMDYQAFNIMNMGEQGTSFDVLVENCEYKVHVPVPGIHNVYNALAAIAAGTELKIPMESIIRGISEFRSGKMRLNIIYKNEIKIIDDAYNASPNSMEAALSVLKDIGGEDRTIAVLGDMLEMGDWAYDAHLNVGKFAVTKNIDYIITVGQQGKNIGEGALSGGMKPDNIFSFETIEDAGKFLTGFVKKSDVLLVKGSRGMRMEKIVEQLSIDNG